MKTGKGDHANAAESLLEAEDPESRDNSNDGKKVSEKPERSSFKNWMIGLFTTVLGAVVIHFAIKFLDENKVEMKTPDTIRAGKPYTFENSKVFGDPVDWYWTITDTGKKPVTLTGYPMTYTFPLPGKYTVGLSYRGPIKLDNNYHSAIIDVKYPEPAARFQIRYPVGKERRVGLTNTSDNAAYYQWDFGDNTEPVREVNTTKLYQHAGTYTIKLTAFNKDSSAHSVSTSNITIKENAPAIVTETTSVVVDPVVAEEVSPPLDDSELKRKIADALNELRTADPGQTSIIRERVQAFIYSSGGHERMTAVFNRDKGSEKALENFFKSIRLESGVIVIEAIEWKKENNKWYISKLTLSSND